MRQLDLGGLDWRCAIGGRACLPSWASALLVRLISPIGLVRLISLVSLISFTSLAACSSPPHPEPVTLDSARSLGALVALMLAASLWTLRSSQRAPKATSTAFDNASKL